jgi:hypothetical protein
LEPIKIVFKNSAYEPDFTFAHPQASLAKPTKPLKWYWMSEQDPTSNHTTHTVEIHTTQLLEPKTGQAGF